MTKSTCYYDYFVVFSLTIFCSEDKCTYILEISTKIFISNNFLEILTKISEISTGTFEISTEIFEIQPKFLGLWRTLEGSGRLLRALDGSGRL